MEFLSCWASRTGFQRKQKIFAIEILGHRLANGPLGRWALICPLEKTGPEARAQAPMVFSKQMCAPARERLGLRARRSFVRQPFSPTARRLQADHTSTPKNSPGPSGRCSFVDVCGRLDQSLEKLVRRKTGMRFQNESRIAWSFVPTFHQRLALGVLDEWLPAAVLKEQPVRHSSRLSPSGWTRATGLLCFPISFSLSRLRPTDLWSNEKEGKQSASNAGPGPQHERPAKGWASAKPIADCHFSRIDARVFGRGRLS